MPSVIEIQDLRKNNGPQVPVTHSEPRTHRTYRSLVFVLFLAGGLMIFLLGNNWNSLFPTNDSTLYKWSLPGLFLALAAALRRSKRFQEYWGIAFALFVASFANALNWYCGNWLAGLLPRAVSTAQELAVDKLAQAIPVVFSILLLMRLSGHDLGSLFLKKGNLRWGLRFGLISFGVWAAIFAVIAVLQASAPPGQGLFATGVPLATIVAAVPWIVVWAFTNSLMEELWFRGVFLRKLTPVLGAAATVLVTALVFALPHFGATYIAPVERVIFAIIVFGLGLVNGSVMLKTDSIWGSVLFHAGYDLLIIIPVLVS
jgi:membrane protease YdiL (CAAX protease family)